MVGLRHKSHQEIKKKQQKKNRKQETPSKSKQIQGKAMQGKPERTTNKLFSKNLCAI